MYTNHCFVDTSAWFALFVPTDPDHRRVKSALEATNFRLLTTDYILDETLTLLRARRQAHRARDVWRVLHSVRIVTLIHVTEADVEAAWQIFQRFTDKNWSFTDCTSKHFIDTNGIPLACSLDGHFGQFGTVTVLPA